MLHASITAFENLKLTRTVPCRVAFKMTETKHTEGGRLHTRYLPSLVLMSIEIFHPLSEIRQMYLLKGDNTEQSLEGY